MTLRAHGSIELVKQPTLREKLLGRLATLSIDLSGVTTRAHGIDISYWQTSFDASVRPDPPINFAIQRATYGITKDGKFESLQEDISPIEIRGAYGYLRSGYEWKAQADLFLELTHDSFYHMHAIDFETAYNVKSAEFANNARKWLEYVQPEISPRLAVLYTNPSTYKDWLMPYGNWMREWPLWIAQYWYAPSPNKNPGMAGMDRDDWALYQYSADSPPNYKGREYGVESTHIDLNVFNGTLEDMKEYFNISDDPVDPDPTLPPVDCRYEEIQDIVDQLREETNLRLDEIEVIISGVE